MVSVNTAVLMCAKTRVLRQFRVNFLSPELQPALCHRRQSKTPSIAVGCRLGRRCVCHVQTRYNLDTLYIQHYLVT